MSDQNIVKASRSKIPPKGWVKSRRRTAYQAPPPSRFRRILRLIFNGWTISTILLILLGVFLTLIYYWFEFSDRIDQKLLSGEVYTASAGIYSAPKTLKVGEEITPLALIDYLKSAGYIEKNSRADASRSRYSFEGDNVAIEPGMTGMIDGKKVFPSLTVKFSKDQKSVGAIGDRDTGAQANEATLEPKILRSIASEGADPRTTGTFN